MHTDGQTGPRRPQPLTAKLLLALATTVIFGSESRGTHDHILLSNVSGSRATVVRGHSHEGKYLQP
jgi:hypothetical protein